MGEPYLEAAREFLHTLPRPRHELRMSGTPHEDDCAALAALLRAHVAKGLRMGAAIAMGSTGPGNTTDQSQGYSDACREIWDAIRAKAMEVERG